MKNSEETKKAITQGFTITPEIEEKEKIKTRILKYVLYKKRSENEVRLKFKDEFDENLFEEVLEKIKELKYLDDNNYIESFVNNAIKLNNLSMKELKYKLLQKGIDKNLISKYFEENYDKIFEFEQESARKIFAKKSGKDILKIRAYLMQKGYLSETIKEILECQDY